MWLTPKAALDLAKKLSQVEGKGFYSELQIQIGLWVALPKYQKYAFTRRCLRHESFFSLKQSDNKL